MTAGWMVQVMAGQTAANWVGSTADQMALHWVERMVERRVGSMAAMTVPTKAG